MLAWQLKIVVVAAAAAAAWPSPARAQVEVVPALGYYWPVGGWTQQLDDGSGTPPLRRQLSAGLLGTRLSVRLTNRVALEGTFGATPSQVAVSTANNTIDYNGGVFLASARAVVKVATLIDGPSEDRRHWDLLLGAGAGLVHRAGTAWENTSGVTAPALVLAAGVTAGAFRVTVEDYVSWAQFDGGRPSQTRARMHNDVIVSLGFALRLGGS
jgi:hypothetical protein